MAPPRGFEGVRRLWGAGELIPCLTGVFAPQNACHYSQILDSETRPRANSPHSWLRPLPDIKPLSPCSHKHASSRARSFHCMDFRHARAHTPLNTNRLIEDYAHSSFTRGGEVKKYYANTASSFWLVVDVGATEYIQFLRDVASHNLRCLDPG